MTAVPTARFSARSLRPWVGQVQAAAKESLPRARPCWLQGAGARKPAIVDTWVADDSAVPVDSVRAAADHGGGLSALEPDLLATGGAPSSPARACLEICPSLRGVFPRSLLSAPELILINPRMQVPSLGKPM